MSIASLCTGHTLVEKPIAVSVGSAMGVAYTPGTASNKTCLMQTVSASESLGFKARDQRATHMAFFSSNPSLEYDSHFTWTDAAGTVHVLRLLGAYDEGRPGVATPMLWIAEFEEDKGRLEAANG
jgi:hypothetical protein